MQRHMPLSFIIYYTSIVCFKDCSVCNMFIDIEWEILFFLFDHFLYSNICSGSCTLNIKAVPTVRYFFLFNLLNIQFLTSWILHEHHDIYFAIFTGHFVSTGTPYLSSCLYTRRMLLEMKVDVSLVRIPYCTWVK